MPGQSRRFEVGACLGRGGFGDVYRAVVRSPGGLSTEVALKILRPEVELGVDAVRRLRDEGRLLARIDHPAILKVHDLVRLDGRLALVTEYVDGEDLGDCAAGPTPIPASALIQVIGSVASGLSAAHGARGAAGEPLGLVHRDVKPRNIRVGRHGHAKLLDFGIAWSRAEDREARTDSGLVVGSLPYMSPERFLERAALPAWDVYGLGVSLFEGLARQRFHVEGPLRDLSAMALDRGRYASFLARRLRALPADLPRSAVDLVQDLLDYEPESRPCASEVERRCEAVHADFSGPALAQWCRERVWAGSPAIGGPLEGRVLDEEDVGEPAARHGSPRITPIEELSARSVTSRPPPEPDRLTPTSLRVAGLPPPPSATARPAPPSPGVPPAAPGDPPSGGGVAGRHRTALLWLLASAAAALLALFLLLSIALVRAALSAGMPGS